MLLLLDLGTEDGPSVCTKIVLNLDYCSVLQTNLKLGVRVLMNFHSLHGCEIVDGFLRNLGVSGFL